jgi:glucose dehydrogenase
MRLAYGLAVAKQKAISLFRSTVEPGVPLRGKGSGGGSLNSRLHILLVIALLAPGLLASCAAPAQTEGKVRGAAAEWSTYGGDKASSKYSPLDQIGTGNFNRLWTWRSPDEAITKVNPDLKTWVRPRAN